MNFKDIFKSSFLNEFATGIDLASVLIGLLVTTLIAVYIFFIYRLVTRKTFYSRTFNLSLIAMAVITAAIILTIQSNIVLSLGMVGALSIVRFRTAIKDPLDLVFLYWSISIGIICGARLYVIAVILTLAMSLVILIMQKYPSKKLSLVLVVNSTNPDNDKQITQTVEKYCKNYQIKSKNLTPSTLDMIIEVKLDDDSAMLKELLALEGVTSASILSHDGEITA